MSQIVERIYKRCLADNEQKRTKRNFNFAAL